MQSNSQPSQTQPLAQFKTPNAAAKPPLNSSVASVSACTTAVSTTRSSSLTSTTTTQKGGSRVYKVVKRETTHPSKRESSRWICYDFGDVQTPNLGFVAPSASDSRIAYDPTQAHPNQLPMSVSATSVPSSASAYSLQHSDSTSSIHKESTHSYGTSAVSTATVQHSASASSVNYDSEFRKIAKLNKLASDAQENSSKFLPADER